MIHVRWAGGEILRVLTAWWKERIDGRLEMGWWGMIESAHSLLEGAN